MKTFAKREENRNTFTYSWFEILILTPPPPPRLVLHQLFNEDAHRTPRAARASTWPTAPTRTTASPTCPASSPCCCAPSPTPRPATGPSACRETTWWASRTSASWPPGCCSAPWSGPRTSHSSPICSSWTRWDFDDYIHIWISRSEGSCLIFWGFYRSYSSIRRWKPLVRRRELAAR